MVTAEQAAIKAARKAIESTYHGVLVVTEYQKVKDEQTKVTDFRDVPVLENQPCKLSFEKITTAVQSESAATIAQTTKLFLSPDVIIKAGSKITVTQSNITNEYQASGVPAIYDTHQEIILNLFKEWA